MACFVSTGSEINPAQRAAIMPAALTQGVRHDLQAPILFILAVEYFAIFYDSIKIQSNIDKYLYANIHTHKVYTNALDTPLRVKVTIQIKNHIPSGAGSAIGSSHICRNCPFEKWSP